MTLHCFTAYTLPLAQGIVSHFPYLSMTPCVRPCCSVCLNGTSSPCDRWGPPTHSSSKSLLDAVTFTPPKNFWTGVGGGGLYVCVCTTPVELDRLKICALAGSVSVLEDQSEPNEAKASQGFGPKACARIRF